MASALPSELIARIRAASIAAADAEAAEAGGGYQKSRPPSVRIAAGGRVVRAPQKVPAERDVSALRDQRALGRLVRTLEHDGALPRSPSSTLPRSPSAWPSSPTSAASRQLDAPPAGEEAAAAAKPASRWAASSIMSLRATLRLVDMFGHKEADVDASAGAVQRAWRKRRQSVDLDAAQGHSEAQA
jgi:hypothetical protein